MAYFRSASIALLLVLLSAVGNASAACQTQMCTDCKAHTWGSLQWYCEVAQTQLQADCLTNHPPRYPRITGTTPGYAYKFLPRELLNVPSSGVSVIGRETRLLCTFVTTQLQVDCMSWATADTEFVCILCRNQLCGECLKPNNRISSMVKTTMCPKIQTQLQLDCLRLPNLSDDEEKARVCTNIQTQLQLDCLRLPGVSNAKKVSICPNIQTYQQLADLKAGKI